MRSFVDLPTVFHITHYKSGSQWVYNVLDATAPQRIMPPRVEVAHFLGQRVVRGMIYPTVYVTRDEFESVRVPEDHIKFVTIRDLRDSIVSWYFSVSKSHRETPNVKQGRQVLNVRDKEQGLQLALSTQGPQMANLQVSWVDAGVPIIKYEDMLQDQHGFFADIMDYCQIPISENHLQRIVEKFSFKQVSGRTRGTENTAAHLRKGVSGDWRNHITGKLLYEFKERFDDVLIATGYEQDRDWGLDLLPEQYQGVDLPYQHQVEAPSRCWCGGTEFEVFSARYHRCLTCGTLLSDTPAARNGFPPMPGWLTYSALANNAVSEQYLAFEIRKLTTQRNNLKKLEAVLTYLEPGAKVLEINTGVGAFLSLLQRSGYDVTGVNLHDSTENLREFQRAELGLEIHCGLLEQQTFEAADFDAILLTHLLSHIMKPREALAQALQWLKPDGILIIETSLLTDPRPYEELQAGGSRTLLDLVQRLPAFYFTPESLQRLLTDFGFSEFIDMVLPDPNRTPRKKSLGQQNTRTLLIASRKPLEPNPEPLAMLSQRVQTLPILALFDLESEIQLAYDTLEHEREISIDQLKTMTESNPEVLQSHMIKTGHGWYPVEFHHGHLFSWISNNAEIIIQPSEETTLPIYLEIEPGPSIEEPPLQLMIYHQDGSLVRQFTVGMRQTIHIDLPVYPHRETLFQLVAANGDSPVPNDSRILNFRLFRMGVSRTDVLQQNGALFAGKDLITLGKGWYNAEVQNDRVFCWANNDAEIRLSRLTGHQRRLWLELQAGPSLQEKSFDLHILDERDNLLATTTVQAHQRIELELPPSFGPDALLRLRVDSNNLPIPNDRRILNFRVFGFGWSDH